MHLVSVEYHPDPGPGSGEYPFSVPLVRSLGRLEFREPVTMLVGENGSGKSTLLEAIASAANCTAVGAESVARDPSLEAARRLAARLRLGWRRRTHRGFFLRAEDFFSFAKRMNSLRGEMEADLQEFDRTYKGRSELARQLARGVYTGSIGAMERRYGADLDGRSHGESFLALFQARMVPDGLYLLDEPETPLSPTRQLALIALMREMVGQGCQFLIATHSPILMAYPGAQILSCDESPPRRVGYEELEHVRVTRDFLNNPESYLRRL